MAPHEAAFIKAKISLMNRKNSVFFSTIFFSVQHKWTEDVTVAATDGQSIFMNPKHFTELNLDSQVYLLTKMAMHVAYMHPLRTMGRDLDSFNKAASEAVNLQLHDNGFTYSHPDVHMKGNSQYRDMSAEQIYQKLPPQPKKNNNGPQQNDPGNAVLPPGANITPDQLQQQIQEIVTRAAIQAKQSPEGAGSIPGDIQLELDKFLNPTLPWFRILARYLKNKAKNDYSMSKPNKRFMPEFYLPSMISSNVIDLVVAPDVSGSCSDEDVRACMNEVAGVFAQLKPEKVTLLPFDTKIREAIDVKNKQELQRVKFTGRGGTDITPVIEWANENKPQVVIVFSDGEFDFPNIKTNVDFIWLIYGNPRFTAPYGKVIHYEVKA